MPVSVLFVEGKLDAELLGAVFKGGPSITRGGTKYDLAKRALEQRTPQSTVSYVRDRDFDLDPPPPNNRSCPQEDRPKDSNRNAIGYFWCRHEIENYLLEPAIVSRTLGCDGTHVRDALLEAGARILDYQAARGAIGVTRRELPPNYKFETRPEDAPGEKLKLPEDLSPHGVTTWMKAHAEAFRSKVCPMLEAKAMERIFRERRELLSEDVQKSADEILIHFSGKDLFAALGSWIQNQKRADVQGPGDLRSRVRDWMRDNPEETLTLLPEWGAFLDLLKR